MAKKRRSKKKFRNVFHKQAGFAAVLLLGIVIMLAIILAGGFTSLPQEPGTASPSASFKISCCDTRECKPKTGPGQTLRFGPDNAEYGLLKSNAKLSETISRVGNPPFFHLQDSGLRHNGNPIIISTAQGYNPGRHPTDIPDGSGCPYEALASPVYNRCIKIEDDQFVYVCKDKCFQLADYRDRVCAPSNRPDLINTPIPGGSKYEYYTSCYGDPNGNSVYDVYHRLRDTVPSELVNCQNYLTNVTITPASGGQTIVGPKDTGSKQSLQLKTYTVESDFAIVQAWLSPFCKPAIYLYPEEKTDVNVKVNTVGNMTYTIPQYPSSGWSVTAYPSGTIHYAGKNFEYLYYEAELPDEEIEKPTKGFVWRYKDVEASLRELLPKLGLNEKETDEFVTYWTQVLPLAPYYFVGVMPQFHLNQLAPLTIHPEPDKLIRVTLYFQALQSSLNIAAPTIQTPERDGFTVVEWGGIFKKDPNYNFSCFN